MAVTTAAAMAAAMAVSMVDTTEAKMAALKEQTMVGKTDGCLVELLATHWVVLMGNLRAVLLDHLMAAKTVSRLAVSLVAH